MNTLLSSGGMPLFIILLIVVTNRTIWVGLQKKWTGLQCVGISTLIVFSLVLFTGLLSQWLTEFKLISQWNQEFERSLNTTLDLYQQMGWKGEEIARAGQLVRIFFKDAIFAWLAIFMGLFSMMSYFIQRKLAPQLTDGQPAFKAIESWYAPYEIIWLTMAALLFIVIGSRWQTINWLYLIGINQVVLIALVYGLVGIGIAFYYINYKKWTSLAKVILILLISLIPMILFLVIFLGLTDTWWNWRGLIDKSAKGDQSP